MKKSEILKVFGNRAVFYRKHEEINILVVNVTELGWKDLNPRIVEKIIDIRPWDGLTIRVSFECDIWD